MRRIAAGLVAATIGCSPAPDAPAPFVDVTATSAVSVGSVPAYDAAIAGLDVYLGNHGDGARLLRHRGGFAFDDVTAASGIDPLGDQHGAAFGDFDGDGHLDLYVALGADRGREAKANRLWRSLGEQLFVDQASAAGVQDPIGRGRTVAWIDVDRDGHLDLFVGNYASPNALFRNRGDGTFEDIASAAGLIRPSAIRAVWADYDADGAPDVLFNATPKGARLLHNRGDGTFEDVTERSGIRTEAAQGAAFGDADGDGDLDLALAAGTDFPASLLVRDGWLTFAAFPEGPATLLDVTRGTDDLRVELWNQGEPANGAFACEAMRCRLAWRGGAARLVGRIGPGASAATAVDYTPWRARHPHVLVRQRSDGTFGRPEPLPGPPGNGQGVAWGDIDNDGDLDLLVVQSGIEGADEPDALFVNDSSGHFVRASLPAGEGRGCGAHFADWNGDGALDLLVTAGWGMPPVAAGRHRLFRNAGARGHWLMIDLADPARSLGARVTVEAAGRRFIRHHLTTGLYSQSVTPIHVGLGAATHARVTVAWPHGRVDVVETDADRTVQLNPSFPQSSAGPASRPLAGRCATSRSGPGRAG